MNLNNFRRMLPGLLISLVLIGAILYFVDLRAMFDAMRSANKNLLLITLLIGISWIFMRTVVWRTLLRDRVSYKEVLFTLSEGYLLNNFLPFRLGEIGRAFLLSRKSDLKFVEILSTILIERAVDLAIAGILLIVSVSYVTGVAGAQTVGIISASVVIGGLFGLYLLARNRNWALDVFHKLSQRWVWLQRFGGHFIESFLTGLAVLTDGWLFSRFLFFMFINWGMAIVQYYLLILAFFPQAQYLWGLFAISAAAFGGGVPSLPGGVGTFDSALGGAIALVSGDPSTSFAVALVMRFYNYFVSGIIGAYALSREGQTLAGMYGQLMKVREKESDI